jgi:YidC/Oxa1 family membrane protein insertase
MKFLGLNLGLVPSYSLDKLLHGINHWQYIGLLIIPILATITTFISTKLTMPKSSDKTEAPAGPAESMQKNMMYIAPVLTLMFSFQFPAGLGLYWIVGYVFQIFQQLYLNKFILNVPNKKEVVVK